MRMLELGAELPLFGPENMKSFGYLDGLDVLSNLASCPDLAEGLPKSCFLPLSERG